MEVSTLSVRTLPVEEWAKLHDAPGPLPQWLQGKLPPADSTVITVIEDAAGQIHGYWVIFSAVHLEPLYLSESVRHHPKAAVQLMQEVGKNLKEYGVTAAFGIIGDADLDTVAPMAQRAGFEQLPGTLYAIRLND
jgi:hypothetical protein